MPDIRSDFSQAAVVTPADFHWVTSPGGEVERVMLDRVGDEVAVATSLVRYPPGSRFPPHEHGLGEEYLVLEGEFADERGRYPPGTYVRNPPGSRHTPFSDPGCVIWVKLRQFHPDDDRQLVMSLLDPLPEENVTARELHRYDGEVVTAITAAADAAISLPAGRWVQEVLIVEGVVSWLDQPIAAPGWLRVPAGAKIELTTGVPSRLLHKTRPEFAVPTVSSARSSASAGT